MKTYAEIATLSPARLASEIRRLATTTTNAVKTIGKLLAAAEDIKGDKSLKAWARANLPDVAVPDHGFTSARTLRFFMEHNIPEESYDLRPYRWDMHASAIANGLDSEECKLSAERKAAIPGEVRTIYAKGDKDGEKALKKLKAEVKGTTAEETDPVAKALDVISKHIAEETNLEQASALHVQIVKLAGQSHDKCAALDKGTAKATPATAAA